MICKIIAEERKAKIGRLVPPELFGGGRGRAGFWQFYKSFTLPLFFHNCAEVD